MNTLLVTMVLMAQGQTYEFVAPPNSKPVLMSTIEGSHRQAVPSALGLKQLRAIIDEKATVEFEFAAVLTEVRRATVEVWFEGRAERSCYVASLAKFVPLGLPNQKGTMFLSHGSVRDLKPAGSFQIAGNKVRFQFNTKPDGKPIVAIVRWLPDALYQDAPNELWTSSVSILLPPGSKGVIVPSLSASG